MWGVKCNDHNVGRYTGGFITDDLAYVPYAYIKRGEMWVKGSRNVMLIFYF